MSKFQGTRFSSVWPVQPKVKFRPVGSSLPPDKLEKIIPHREVAFYVNCKDGITYEIYVDQNCSLEDAKGFARCLSKFEFRITDGSRKHLMYKGK